MAASCIHTITEYVIVVWLWRNSVFLWELIENRSAKMEFPCLEIDHGDFMIACILYTSLTGTVRRGNKGSWYRQYGSGAAEGL